MWTVTHARCLHAVAAALEAASAAVVEEHEVPPEFDPSSAGLPAPLARAFYRQVSRWCYPCMLELSSYRCSYCKP